MSYQALARKWRPSQFAELVGQEHVVRVLTHALEEDRLHHAYLFTGTRGVGKTTVARLLALCLNCVEGTTASSCGQCDACLDLRAGRFVDLVEIDAASHTGVDNIRTLLDNAQFPPVRGRYKIYLIDEVHMLSKAAFNALLMTLEEPPEHIKFLLATTDPSRLPVTILSRCLQFHLRNLDPSLIASRVEQILNAEKIPFESAGVNRIARAAAGSMRDALSLVDQAIGLGEGRVLESEVTAMLGVVDADLLEKMFTALAEDNAESLLSLADEYMAGTPDVDALFSAMASLARQISLVSRVPKALDKRDPSAKAVLKLHPVLSDEALQVYYQAALSGRKDLPFAPDATTCLHMTLLRMLAFAPLLKLGKTSSASRKNISIALQDSASSSGSAAPNGPSSTPKLPNSASPSVADPSKPDLPKATVAQPPAGTSVADKKHTKTPEPTASDSSRPPRKNDSPSNKDSASTNGSAAPNGPSSTPKLSNSASPSVADPSKPDLPKATVAQPPAGTSVADKKHTKTPKPTASDGSRPGRKNDSPSNKGSVSGAVEHSDNMPMIDSFADTSADSSSSTELLDRKPLLSGSGSIDIASIKAEQEKAVDAIERDSVVKLLKERFDATIKPKSIRPAS